MLDGLLDLSFLGVAVALLLLTHITIASVTIFLHRHQAHHSVDLHPLVSHFFRFWLWMSTGMVTREWVAVHRKHHATCETKDDPHSPQVKGLRKVLWDGVDLYRKETRNKETIQNYGQGTPDDWLERHVYDAHPMLGVLLMLVVDCLLFGVLGISVFALQMIWIPFWAAGVINGLGHFWGYRSFETSDASSNIMPIGILIGGEEFHNNHHAYASSARLSNKWWEFDIGWFYICSLQYLGLAKVKRVAPKSKFEPSKAIVDFDTVSAVVRNRFHVMTLYGRNVIKPVIQQEKRHADVCFKKILKRAKRLMIREDIKIDLDAKEIINQAVAQSQALETVYHFKQTLKELWLRTYSNQEKRVAALQEWCRQAELTGIKVLQEFAQSIRGYSLQAA